MNFIEVRKTLFKSLVSEISSDMTNDVEKL